MVDYVLTHGSADERCLIAIAGPPAAGKSTVAKQVVKDLNNEGRSAGLVPMDGFHMDNADLIKMGLLERKGAPETFDLDGFTSLVRSLKQGGHVMVPLFDRQKDSTIPNAAEIAADVQFVVVEGNYLLFDEHGWKDLVDLWDITAFIFEDAAELERRLTQRWVRHGLSLDDAKARAQTNDLPNALRVLSQKLDSNLTL